ncbi:carbohydrate ABC transporter permease [bacterium]|nr:carbohydrate ABC transporter permease [bacterium]
MMAAGSLRDGGWRNYAAVLSRVDFCSLFLNSLCISAVVVVLGSLINSMAGYTLARASFRGRGLLLSLVLLCMMIPFEAVAVPLFYTASRIGLRDTLVVQTVPFLANAFSIYLFYTFYLNFPRELEEAARLDGAETWQIYLRVALPGSAPVLASNGIITLLASWNSYLWPLLVTSTARVRPLSLAIAIFHSAPPLDWAQIFAFGVLMVSPTLLLFLLLQRHIQPNALSSGIK